MRPFEDNVVLVTGAGSGIGLAVSERFVDGGARLVAVGRRPEPLADLARRFGDRVASCPLDLAHRGEPRRAIDLAIARFGKLDVLVNNAGAFVRKTLDETTDDDIARLLAINVAAPLALSREAATHLEKARGCIINITSAAANYARPALALYAATKAAVQHATRVLAVELGPRAIRVNAVAPGMTRTDMTAHLFEDEQALSFLVKSTALGRVGEPADVAAVVTFLASAEAAWVTGQTIAASGGLLL